MSKSITPEWIRLKREIQALVGGIWHELARLEEWLHSLDKRIRKLEEKKEDPPIFPQC